MWNNCLFCLRKTFFASSFAVFLGVVSSGTLSPCLNKGIALAYVHPEFREKDNILDVVIRGKQVKAKVVKPPFVKKDGCKQN